MKKNLLLAAAFVFAGSLASVQAESKEEVKDAIKKLTEAGNYSWTSTTARPEGAGGGGAGAGRGGAAGATNGKFADGLVYLTSTRGDRTTESLVKGEKAATKGQDGWAAVEVRPAGDAAGGQGRQRFGRGRNLLNFKAPATQAEELLGQVAELKKDGDVYTGALTEEAAKGLVTFGGGGRRGGAAGGNADRPQPTGVKATAKFWIKDGVLAKYETVTAGTISFNGNDRDLGRTTTVEIKDAGSTKIEVPEEAKKLVTG